MTTQINTAKVRVLLVEDSPSDAALFQESLALEHPFGFTVAHAECWADARQRLKQSVFDVMMLDLSLLDTNSRATFLQARAEAPELPIVVMTGVQDETIGMDAVRHGIQDFLPKGHTDGRTIARSIRYAIERQRAEVELRRARDELELRVRERTAELEETVGALKMEIDYRKVAEVALRDSEQRYRTLFETAPVGLGITRLNGEVLMFNRFLCLMAGLSPEEAKTVRAESFYAVPAQRRRLLAQLRKEGKVESQEVVYKRKDGSTLLVRVRMEGIRLGDQQALLTMVEDITRQKQADRHLEGVAALLTLFVTRSSRREYLADAVKLLANWCGCSCVGVRLAGEQDRLPYAAQVGFSRQFLKHENALCFSKDACACCRILTGRSKPDDAAFSNAAGTIFCNQSSRYVAELADRPQHCAQVACVTAGYESLAHIPIRYRDELLGTLHFADKRAHKFPVETIAFIEATAPLIGEAIHRFKVEESLLESEARFRTIFEHNEAAMLLVEPKSGTIVSANNAAVVFYGYSGDQLRRMKFDDLNQLPAEAITTPRRSASNRQGNFFVFPHRLANGQVRIVEVYSSPIRIKGQTLLFSILHDITERRQLEKQVLETSEQERQRVGVDLHDSLGGQLAGTAMMCKALATKLAIGGNGEAALAEEVVGCINVLISHTRSIARGLCPVELTVSGLTGGLADFAADTQRRSGVSCRFVPVGQVQVQDLFVATHLYRITQEAVNNAIHHGRSKHVTIRLTRADKQLSLEILDDGVWLSKKPDAAKGLGLRTMNYRADLIGARLIIRPGEGGGTVVSCTLPLQNPGVRSPRSPKPAEENALGTPRLVSGAGI